MTRKNCVNINSITPGDSLYFYYGANNINNRKIHIIARVTDRDTDVGLIVYKYWLRHKKRWYYHAEPTYIFEHVYNEMGSLRRSLPRKRNHNG